jgi:hypothetical protein
VTNSDPHVIPVEKREDLAFMRFLDLIQRRIRDAETHVESSEDVNTAVAANVGRPGSSTHVSSRQRVVRRGNQKVVVESRKEERSG